LLLGGPLPYGPVLLPIVWSWDWAGVEGVRPGRGQAPGAGVFSTVVNLPAKLSRNLARYPRAHVYCETNDVLLADYSMVVLQSLKSEEKRLALPGEFRVRDLISGAE